MIRRAAKVGRARDITCKALKVAAVFGGGSVWPSVNNGMGKNGLDVFLASPRRDPEASHARCGEAKPALLITNLALGLDCCAEDAGQWPVAFVLGGLLGGMLYVSSACDDNAVTEACKENSRAACEDADGLTLRVVGILSEIRSTGARHV
jgi:hypothetical protein